MNNNKSKVLITDEKVDRQITLIEADQEGLHVHFIDGTVDFLPWRNGRFEDGENASQHDPEPNMETRKKQTQLNLF